MDKSIFFDRVRSSVFSGRLKQSQVDGLELIMNEADRRGVNNEHLSYIFSTSAHETAYTMQPIREYGRGKGRPYGVPHAKTGQIYYGRGFVQLTWYENYLKATQKLGVNFVDHPDLVMVPKHAVKIMFDGMAEGWFTGKGLDDYLDGVDEDYKEDLREFSNARRIINGTDKQVHIGKLAIKFEEALRASGRPESGSPALPSSEDSDASPTPAPAPGKDPSDAGKAVSVLLRILRIIFKLFKSR